MPESLPVAPRQFEPAAEKDSKVVVFQPKNLPRRTGSHSFAPRRRRAAAR